MCLSAPWKSKRQPSLFDWRGGKSQRVRVTRPLQISLYYHINLQKLHAFTCYLMPSFLLSLDWLILCIALDKVKNKKIYIIKLSEGCAVIGK